MADSTYFLEDDATFIIKSYNSCPPFSNFLPGVAGAWGVPMWVFYTNRGQAIAAFGTNDKEHAISEFFPANKAYAFTPSLGFRTFLKLNGKFYEPFSLLSGSGNEQMSIRSASFSLEESHRETGLKTRVKYFTLCNTRIPALVRVLSLQNTSTTPLGVEGLDGLSVVVPVGMSNFFLKEMSRTIEAWMRAEVVDGTALFKLVVDPKDVSKTEYVSGANFNHTFYEENGKKIIPQAVVDPQVIFDQDTTYALPRAFLQGNFTIPAAQIGYGKTPCSFNHFRICLDPGEEKVIYTIIGTAASTQALSAFTKTLTGRFINDKERENEEMIEALKDHAGGRSAFKRLDHYVKATYLDNVLRGGYPYPLGNDDFYYIFSRKHGDLERDYNRFRLVPSYFSEGEANYRDINQNRRLDSFFNSRIGARNIEYFLSLIKMDSYNPLTVKGEKFRWSVKGAKKLLKQYAIEDKTALTLMTEGFYLGELAAIEAVEALGKPQAEEFLAQAIRGGQREPIASFGEGCWIDHWHYNLDLIENYLYFYPDKKDELFTAANYLFWDDEHRVKERARRYSLKDGRVFQYHALEAVKAKRDLLLGRRDFANFLRTKNGRLYRTTLTEKLLSIVLNRLATLDPDGVGVEMEADKPGWCDSLNGLPALFGSSLCETLELKRAVLILQDGLKGLQKSGIKKAALCREVSGFLRSLGKCLDQGKTAAKKDGDYRFWDEANSAKEKFRTATFNGLNGARDEIALVKIDEFLTKTLAKLQAGIKKGVDSATGVPLTYFRYEATRYRLKNKAVVPTVFKRHNLPLFLEGAVYAFKAAPGKSLYDNVLRSPLFDPELKMYRLNASLADEPLDVGRSRVFMPGWLENESIWLHMEYKYLLEVLKGGLYEEFYGDFKKCVVCFFDPARYGRSILENSSFIVSSRYPDKNLWGRGFAARLSGATVELLHIWMTMVLGHKPFFTDEAGRLCLQFKPILKKEMFTAEASVLKSNGREVALPENTFTFKLFSSTLVVYHNTSEKDTYADDCRVEKIVVREADRVSEVAGDHLPEPLSLAARDCRLEQIDVYLR